MLRLKEILLCPAGRWQSVTVRDMLRAKMPVNKLNTVSRSFFLTVAAIFVLVGLTGAAMWFITVKLCVAGVYWLVPIFGALGGAVGALLRGSNALELCSLREVEVLTEGKDKENEEDASNETQTNWKLSLGIVGEIAIGLGGATAAVFLFGGTLKFDEHDSRTFVLLVSVSLLAGAFGKDVVVTAGERLLKEAKTEAKEAKVVARIAKKNANMASAIGFTLEAKELLAAEEPNPKEALEMTNLALEVDPQYVNAYGEKGRALSRLGQLSEALVWVEKGLKINPQKAELLYNRVCYRVRLGQMSNVNELIGDLAKAFKIKPELKKHAQMDHDLDPLRHLEAFQRLLGEEAVSG
ncbi:MAG: tetratricopeptide repeat protein [Acidobacteriota bacterium]|nr:tetratricopeptide repeat protein [Acidobacteriota bacterium]